MRFEDLDYLQKQHVLVKLHRIINMRLFDGKLKSICIDIANAESIDAYAEFHPQYKYVENDKLVDTSLIALSHTAVEEIAACKTLYGQRYLLFMYMLHEMTHQYCHENNIDDSDHNILWVQEAESRGLISIYDYATGEHVDEYLTKRALAVLACFRRF